MADKNEALFKLGSAIREAIDEAFDNGGMTIAEIEAEITYQVEEAKTSGEYE